ncbi:MAG TPA: glycogen/starch synthase [Candidatus Paceibacterota bacterium]
MGIFSPKKSLKILFVATEASPFAKVGGLGSVMYSLPKALSDIGYDVRIMMPRYLSIDDKIHNLVIEYKELEVPTNGDDSRRIICNIKRCDPSPDSKAGVTTYFLENMEYYEQRANVYGYADDAIRWALLCRGTLEFLKQSNSWIPDIIVSSDWQTGLIPNYLKTVYNKDPILSKIATVFSIHNLYYQAMFDHHFVSEMDFDDGHSGIPNFDNPRLYKLNFMRRGIMYADAINTVSPTYAREIMTKEFGELLDELLRERRAVLTGILNGIDYSLWDPDGDPHIPNRFSADNLEERAKNKKALQERFGLNVKKDTLIVSVVNRLSRQKGLDMLFPILEFLIKELPLQLVLVGEGDSDMMTYFHNLETQFPGRVAVHLKFDPILPHIVFAGSDITLVPSRFEPCGLVQMEAMRMGCIPIVRKTGGLADSVEDYNPDKDSGTGFVFEKFDSSSMMISLIRAFENFRDKKKWAHLQKRAMSKDFSWDTSAKKYVELFARAIELHK